MSIESRRKAQLKAAADAYFQGLTNKDMSAVPWDENVTFRGPLAPGGAGTPLQGRRAVLDWFTSICPVLGEIRVIEYYINDDLTVVAVRADVGITSPPGTLRVV
ncbi:MAG TPA: nuclear transport factor 2 family protein, partial [Dehalococcoidia bacterium]|nr:nuclear transport factor 2 family protein [Dehalococcoidia bacterium]